MQKIKMAQCLPSWMITDPTVKALAAAIDDLMTHYACSILRTWDQIDKLSDADSDAMAIELNILWYDASGELSKKHIQIKESDEIWRTLGTRYAVEKVISQIFGDANLLEFWQYPEGKPHHVKITLEHAGTLTKENEKEFMRIFEIVKRKSQILDKIELVLNHSMNVYAAAYTQEIEKQYIYFRQKENQFIGPYPFTGFAIHEVEKMTI